MTNQTTDRQDAGMTTIGRHPITGQPLYITADAPDRPGLRYCNYCNYCENYVRPRRPRTPEQH